MKNTNKHSDENIGKSFSLWVMFDLITRMKNFDDLLGNRLVDGREKERVFKILKIFSLAVVIETGLVELMDHQYMNFSDENKQEIRDIILKKIKSSRKVTLEKAEELISEQLGNSKKIIISPILQYLAGYSMGGLISFAENNFDFEKKLLDDLYLFKDSRNLIIHNSTSTRHDIDNTLEEALRLGNELQKVMVEMMQINLSDK